MIVDVIDLNIEYMRTFRGVADTCDGRTLGDHGKNRVLLAQAAEYLFACTGLSDDEAVHLPDTADPAAGMHFRFDTLDRYTARAATPGSYWSDWLHEVLFGRVPAPPVVGISVMGPSQVFLALVVARMVKRYWPGTVIVLGGSHVTLLGAEMRADPRYLEFVDQVLPGHSEAEFAELVRDRTLSQPKVAHLPPAGRAFDYLPLVRARQLACYDQATVTMPLQFTRGCSYGQCTFCTYPVVEPIATRLDADRAAMAVETLVEEYGVTRFSVKDSLFTVPMMLKFADALDRRGARVRWSATTKITRSLVAHAPRLASAGLTTLEFGVETIHPAGQRFFDKVIDLKVVEEVLEACAACGIVAVLNLIFGLPGETPSQAERQLAWFRTQLRRVPGMVDGSLNMLEIGRGSPLAIHPPPEVELRGVAPWAYCYEWNAPGWRRDFADELRLAELTPLRAGA